MNYDEDKDLFHQRTDLFHIPGIILVSLFWSFHDHRYVLECLVVQENLESFLPDLAFADVPVTVYMGIEILQAIVQVHTFEPFETDRTVDLLCDRVNALLRPDIITRSKPVAGVITNAYLIRIA